MTANIPIVTCDDLSAFHAKHFTTQDFNPTVASDFFASSFNNTEAQSTDNDDLYDDRLGYYLDGVKRTLTEEQVQIFRHSEIQALLRQRQLEKESSSNNGSTTSNTREEEKCDKPNNASSNARDVIDQDLGKLKPPKQPNHTNQTITTPDTTTQTTLNKVIPNEKPRVETPQVLKPPTEFRRRIICYEDA
ncbi:hypothetical protein H112_06702 [Trichophyton rubrum D6]|uniref:Uncharacterized protein n=3 Tax=Trichophyton TaxID=5550 RepID=F2SJ67_TRIRC|nr:uncharacterized protein TERG_02051 [Trichophyton rubrum CBS 118892]EZF12392.1 hypothetical protein H100_06718 [Trichophyton rubrum MR850]EZF39362.1 hypothetical protein H102_06685 [Trichophyton rubrum CBS 100081]EZF49816.1 hypothetical protein H103_06709 [Trichophyton rubrum CBS 288.86]EZF60474.1 hypothetical protein H104_06664 [Trichophyton rubrum CBS 289.86]EZF71098.1 hypothetical protein H105_06722 [Trichophyton soudanense CBS 452.61]EZF81837.1 hypothetical protein H110_06706 [Trichophy